MVDIRTEGNAVLLPVKIVPGASRTRLMGPWENRVKIAVASPPEKGKANQAVTTLLAHLLIDFACAGSSITAVFVCVKMWIG